MRKTKKILFIAIVTITLGISFAGNLPEDKDMDLKTPILLEKQVSFVNQDIIKNDKLIKISIFLDTYFSKQLDLIDLNQLDIKDSLYLLNDNEKKYIKEQILDRYKKFRKNYQSLVYSWYSLVPILEKKLNGEKINQISLRYHIDDFKKKLKIVLKDINYLSKAKYYKVEFLTDTNYIEQKQNIDRNYKIYEFRNLLVNGKEVNYLKLIINTKIHKDFKPYKPFKLIIVGDIIKGFNLVALEN